MNSVPRVQTSDTNVNQLQSNIIPPLNGLLQNALVSGQILKGISLASGSNSIPTGLNAPLNGWIVVNNIANVTIYSTGSTNNTLTLVASGATTISLWVF